MIFISYTWADAPVARTIHSNLSSSGQDTWIDYERLDLGSCIESQLREAICSAKTVLLLDSPRARLSKWIRFELACAQWARTPVICLPVPLYELNESQKDVSSSLRCPQLVLALEGPTIASRPTGLPPRFRPAAEAQRWALGGRRAWS